MQKGELVGIGRTAEVYEWGKHAVVKLFYQGKSFGSEAKNASTMHKLGIPTPEVLDVVEIDGRQGIIYERIYGTTMMKLIEPNDSSITKYAVQLAELQAHIHSIQTDVSPNLRQRIMDETTRITRLGAKQRDQVVAQLNLLPDGHAICHFDLHPDNIMITDKGPMIIDWIDVLIGHPLADVCWTSLMLKSNALPAGESPLWLKDRALRTQFHDIYFDTYFKQSNYDPNDLTPWVLPIMVYRFGAMVGSEQELQSILNSL